MNIKTCCLVFLPLLAGCATGDFSYQDGGLPPASEITRDKANRITVKKDFYLDGSTKSISTFEYDDKGTLMAEKTIEPQKGGGRIESETTYSPLSPVVIQKIREFDSEGKLIEETIQSNQPDKIGKIKAVLDGDEL